WEHRSYPTDRESPADRRAAIPSQALSRRWAQSRRYGSRCSCRPPAYSVRGSPVGCSPFLPLRRAGLSWCQRTARCRGRLRKTAEQRVLRARGFGTSSVSVVIELARFCGSRITCGPANAKPLATKRSEENYDKEGDGCRASPAPLPLSRHMRSRDALTLSLPTPSTSPWRSPACPGRSCSHPTHPSACLG